MFQGSIVALVTPMNADGSIDIKSFSELLDFHIQSHSDGICVVGTTGEAATVDFEEHIYLIEQAVKFIRGRIPLIAGTGANSTKEAIYLTQAAKTAGADASLLVTPYYNKPSQRGLVEHHKAIAKAVNLPQLLYNVPSRTGVDMENITVMELSDVKNIVGIKDATGDISRIKSLKKEINSNFSFISGDDLSFTEFLEEGGDGVISVTANVKPFEMHKITTSIKNKNLLEAKQLNSKLDLLHQAMFIESNPIPVKWMLAHMGVIQPFMRLPMVELHKDNEGFVLKALEKANA
ncbi:dihydrodipicolinate synthase [Methylophilales bacterium HTCC2181]|uniref:4-hydroxy-tetrahydrodipicolinate synthase n=1 Tax=Methylophilales bacterium HTCC2181 TaxID=383631 RepID=A0P5P1_9PROT|nr:dihydrodipicolinate synthase [Methylophilales bacterium HTCC2181]